MHDAFLESYRALEVARITKIPSFAKSWLAWKPEILRRTSNLTDADAIFQLGGGLSEIFQSTGEGRTQSSQSGGGTAWEALVCWYLNLVFVGTRALAFKQNRKLVPEVIYDAATVKYGNHKTNTESDISVIVFPDKEFQQPGLTSVVKKRSALDRLISRNMGETHLRVIQCKTNWNDNAQIPMLWDMVYQGNYPPNSTVRIGNNGATIKNFGSFRYCFVTVPSNVNDKFEFDSLCVQRLKGMTGGNYWGWPSKNGVAHSISEIFTNEFDFVFDGSIQSVISRSISDQIGPYSS